MNGRVGADRKSVTPAPPTVVSRRGEARTVVEVSGRMTIDSSSQLRSALLDAVGAASPVSVVVDFTKTDYLDTSAAATLIEAAILALDRGVTIRLVGLHGEPRLLAEIIELDRIFRALKSEVEFA